MNAKTPKKSDSLAFPTDPLAAIRELQDLNETPPVSAKPPPEETAGTNPNEEPEAAHPRRRKNSSATGSAKAREREGTTAKRRSPGPANDSKSSDPMTAAVRELLSKPYTDDPLKGPVTVSTVKIPTEVWQRLGWIATLTKRTKQEIISEALKAHFEQFLKET